MPETATAGTDVLEKRRRYRRLFVGTIVVGAVAGLSLRALDYPMVGEAVYWVAILGALAVWLGTSVSLFDERDAALERRASQLTISISAVVLVVGASAARVLPRVTDLAVPPEVWGALYGFLALFATWAVSYVWLRYRP